VGEENLRRWQACVGVLKIDTVWERVQKLQNRSGKFPILGVHVAKAGNTVRGLLCANVERGGAVP